MLEETVRPLEVRRFLTKLCSTHHRARISLHACLGDNKARLARPRLAATSALLQDVVCTRFAPESIDVFNIAIFLVKGSMHGTGYAANCLSSMVLRTSCRITVMLVLVQPVLICSFFFHNLWSTWLLLLFMILLFFAFVLLPLRSFIFLAVVLLFALLMNYSLLQMLYLCILLHLYMSHLQYRLFLLDHYILFI